MSFTLKHCFIAGEGNQVTNTYSVSRFMHETRGCAGPVEKTGPMVTMYDDRGAHAGVLQLHPGHMLYVENDRGKTIDLFHGDEWMADSQRAAKGAT